MKVFHATAHLSDQAVESIAGVVFAANLRDGRPVSNATFQQRLRRQLAQHDQAPAEQARRGFEPEVAADCGDDGTGCLTITGESVRVAAAFDRCDHAARQLKQSGDRRPLSMLRATIVLDLILYGQIRPTQQALTLPDPSPPRRLTTR